eukprot:2886544-Prymnesium_polylepis.1
MLSCWSECWSGPETERHGIAHGGLSLRRTGMGMGTGVCGMGEAEFGTRAPTPVPRPWAWPCETQTVKPGLQPAPLSGAWPGP